MLDNAYSARFEELICKTSFDVELPIQWKGYFEQRGESPAFHHDQRSSQRLKVRTHALMYAEHFPKFLVRRDGPVGVYTRDFSRRGIGLLTPIQLLPEETFRILLPTFWLRLRAVRVRRVTAKCFEVGCALMQRFDPSMDGFLASIQTHHRLQCIQSGTSGGEC